MISELKNRPGSLTEENIRTIRESIRLIRSSRNLLESTIGDLNLQTIELAQDRLTRSNQPQIINRLDNLSQIQERRLNAYKRLKADLHTLKSAF
ncbi:hypothetical protein [Desulfitibacter alkalitolerans]|uniref:hypothetical protein n=1 Tax=Desulfitibacter alkalitolerans TaxID=264641 RepID=UPI0004828B5A|nr:hypothetical protein [Desulfitibacter alkalitolerans]